MVTKVLQRILALAVVGTLAGTGCTSVDETVSSSMLGDPAIPTTSIAAVASATTTTPSPTSPPTPDPLPLDDLDDLVNGVDSFMASSPDYGEVAEERASLNRRAFAATATLGDYQGDDLVIVEERLVVLRGLRQRLADLVTELGLEMMQDHELGPALDPLNLPRLPREGVAVELFGATVLVDLEGVVWGHLAGFSIDYTSELPGPIKLIDRMGEEFLLAPLAAALLPYEGRIPLAYGAEYAVSERASPGPEGSEAPLRTIVGNGWRHPLGSGETLFASGREIATERIWVEEDSLYEPGQAIVIDLASGAVSDLPEGCWVGARYGETTYLVCRTDSGGRDQVFVNTVDSAPLAPSPNADLRFPVGHWRWLMVSPDGTELLGQWSGECEIPTAFRMWTDGSGSMVTITGAAYELAPASYALGWSAEGQAIALLDGSGACTEPAAQPGVHIFSEDGTSTLLYDTTTYGTARMWQPLAQLQCERSDYAIEFGAEPATAQLAVWVNVQLVDGTVCALDPSGTLSVIDSAGDPVNVDGAPAAVRFLARAGYGPVFDEDRAFSQNWIWQNWCGGEVYLQLDLDDGFSAQLPGSPRCDAEADMSLLRSFVWTESG